MNKTALQSADGALAISLPQSEEKLFYPCSTGYVFAATNLAVRLQLPFYGMVLLSIDGRPIRVTIGGQTIEHLAIALWAKDIRFTVEHARFVTVAVNPLHPLFRAFASIPAPHIIPLAAERYAPFHELMCRAANSRFKHDEALALFNGVLDVTRDALPPTPGLDVRGQALMKCLWDKPRSSLDELAQHLGLSYHRTSHLFTETVGVPIRTYQLWQKLYKAGASLMKGASFTEVAHTAGFVDSAHYSRAFQTAYGRSPTEMFKTRRIIVFYRNAFSETSISESIAAVAD